MKVCWQFHPPLRANCSGVAPRGPVGPSHDSREGAQRTERNYQNREVVLQRQRVIEVLDLCPGDRVLDVGCGPGLLLRDLAEAAGPNGAAVGLDPSKEMLALARKRLSDLDNVQLELGGAGCLPFAEEKFDAIVYTQVLSYVDDVPRALKEARRVLRPHGKLLVLDTDWKGFVLHSCDEERAQRVLASHEHHFLDATLPRKMPTLLMDAVLICFRSLASR